MRPSTDTILMESAKLWAHRGTCTRAQVGVVISRDGRGLVTAYNGAPSGMPHCNHGCDCGVSRGASLPHSPVCRGMLPCKNVVHAEAAAIAFAARHGVGTQGAMVHVTRAPCLTCAGLIINAGIARVMFLEDHREMDGIDRLTAAAIEVVKYNYDIHY